MDAYERNTGEPHPLAGNSPRKRGADPLPLVEDLEGRLWHGSISVGTPPTEFTGLSHINQTLLYKFSY